MPDFTKEQVEIGLKLENAQFPRALKENLPFVSEW